MHNGNEKEEEQRQQEVNWLEYFKGIKHLCPWSLKSYMNNRILHVRFPRTEELTWCGIFYYVGSYDAVLFEYESSVDISQLYAITEKIENQYNDLIAFWSHPDEKDNNTPVPCVIVQDRQTLTDLRKKVGYND